MGEGKKSGIIKREKKIEDEKKRGNAKKKGK